MLDGVYARWLYVHPEYIRELRAKSTYRLKEKLLLAMPASS